MTQEQTLRRKARKRTHLATFQKWIQRRFKESALTEKAFAAWIGAAQSVVHNWLDGSSAPSAPQLLRLREVFDCPIDAMFGFEAPQLTPSTLHDVLLLEQQAVALIRRRLCAMGHDGQFDAWISLDLPASTQEELRQTVRHWRNVVTVLDLEYPDATKSVPEDYFPVILLPGLDAFIKDMQRNIERLPVQRKLQEHVHNAKVHIEALAKTLTGEQLASVFAIDGDLGNLYLIGLKQTLSSPPIWQRFEELARPAIPRRRRGRPRKLRRGEND